MKNKAKKDDTQSITKRKNQGVFDKIPTPRYPILPLIKFLKKDNRFKDCVIWECAGFDNNQTSTITSELRHNNFKVIQTSKKEINFLRDELKEHYDIVITNPPYSIKDPFIKRCIELRIPFAFLLPVDATCGVGRHELYKEYNEKVGSISILSLDNRIDFTNGKSPHSYSVWVLGNLTEKNEYILGEKIDKTKKVRGNNGIGL